MTLEKIILVGGTFLVLGLSSYLGGLYKRDYLVTKSKCSLVQSVVYCAVAVGLIGLLFLVK